MKHTVVTISRQLGSGGAYVGREVARALGMKYVDRDILGEAAKVLQEDPAILERREERVSGFVETLLRTLAVGTPDSDYVPPPYRLIYDKDIIAVESDIMERIARREDAVIVGRGGFHVLKGHSPLINVFLHASKKVRLRRVMDLYDVSEEQAASMAENSDRSRKAFIEKLTGGSWTDALNFHLCVDTGEAGFPIAVEAIVALVRKVQQEQRK